MKYYITVFFVLVSLTGTSMASCMTEATTTVQPLQLTLLAQKQHADFVTVKFLGGLGNLMFEAAAACGIAWDHGALPSFSSIKTLKKSYRNGVFSRFDQLFPNDLHPPFCVLSENTIKKEGTIAYTPNMQLAGYFQSIHYFEKYELELRKLFQPVEEDLRYLRSTYQRILGAPHTVGVQLRYYQDGTNLSSKFIQYGGDYLKKATHLFSPDFLFVVSSNNTAFAKKNWPPEYKNVIFLEGEKDYLEMYLLSMCEHNIITNSSFGFWSAWLNSNPNKIVVRPMVWVGGEKREEMASKNWVMIDAEYNEAAKGTK